MKKRAFITGISGQDAAYLAQLLLGKGYDVFGGKRRNASGSLWRLQELGIADQITYVPFELTELPQMMRVLKDIQPEEIYNLAAQSFVQTSFDHPLYTMDVNGMGVLRLLEAVKTVCPQARVYQASSSEMFGGCDFDAWCIPCETSALCEHKQMYPRSPYGISKLTAYWAVRNAREAKGAGCLYGLFACNGILFNHTSSLRGPEFVTRKITDGIARIAAGQDFVLRLGNLDARRDWGFAGDYVEAMWLMLQQDKPDDFVIATGKTHSVRDFLTAAIRASGLRGELLFEENRVWVGKRCVVRIDQRLCRPAEVDILLGDASKAKRVLGWEPQVGFEELVQMMVEADMRRVRNG